jgi:mono/diheme cytochrome c family protein
MRRTLAAAIASIGAVILGAPHTAAADLTRGQYLVEALVACDNCHTPRGVNGYDFAARLSGGSQTFTDKTYTVRGPNISSDKETGVGGWSDEALRAAIAEGRGRDGLLAPAMPS